MRSSESALARGEASSRVISAQESEAAPELFERKGKQIGAFFSADQQASSQKSGELVSGVLPRGQPEHALLALLSSNLHHPFQGRAQRRRLKRLG